MRSATAVFQNFESECLHVGILRPFWKHCEKLEEITISWGNHRSLVLSADVHRLLSEIRSFQQEMPRNIKCLTNQFPDVEGSFGLLELWQDTLRRIDLRWGDLGEICEGSVAELDSTLAALGACAELREVTFCYHAYISPQYDDTVHTSWTPTNRNCRLCWML